MPQPSSQSTPQRPVRRVWTPPRATCVAARPEISAYSGDINPWPNIR
jgi:hypothetical protein